MAAEHIRHWRVGDVDIARIVEVYGFEDDISMLLPDATPQYVQQFGWLQPHFATPRRPDDHFLPVLRAALERPHRHDRHLHRQRPQARVRRVLQHAEHLPGGSEQRPASRQRRSPMCCARICTSIMWAGTPGWSMAGGCRPSRRRATSSGGAKCSTGSICATPAAIITWTIWTTRSIRFSPPGWRSTSTRISVSPMRYRSSRRRATLPVTSAC